MISLEACVKVRKNRARGYNIRLQRHEIPTYSAHINAAEVVAIDKFEKDLERLAPSKRIQALLNHLPLLRA